MIKKYKKIKIKRKKNVTRKKIRNNKCEKNVQVLYTILFVK